MTNAVAVPDRDGFALVPGSYDEAMKICQMLAKSQLVPTQYQNRPENVFVAVSWGRELGLQPLQALQNIAVIGNRPSLWGDAALAVVMAHPDFEEIEETITGEGEAAEAVCIIKRKGRKPVERRFTVKEAIKAGLWSKSGPWTQYPRRMLQMRARGYAMRDSFPDALRGFSIVEEMQDVEERDITPQDSRPAVVMPKATTPPQHADAPAAESVDMETGEVIEHAPQEPAQADAAPAHEPPPEAEARPAPAEGVPTLSEGQLKVIRARLAAAGVYEVDLTKAFQVPRLEAIASTDANAALAWIKARAS